MNIPPVTLALIVINVLCYFALPPARGLFEQLALWPIGAGFAPWQLLTYGFLHGGTMHIAFNMLALYMFGSDLERVWGTERFLRFYLVCVITAGLVQTIFSSMTGSLAPTVGASGGTFGLLLAFAMYFPQRKLMLIFPPIPMPAWLFVTLYGGIELVLGVTGTASGVAHFAHLGGMLGGYLLIRRWRTR